MNLLFNKKLMLAVVLAVNGMGCGAVQSARDKLNNMDEASFVSLVDKVELVAQTAGVKLKEALAPQDAAAARFVCLLVADAIQNDRVEDLPLFLKSLMKDRNIKFVEDPELNQKILDGINDALDVINIVVGPIELGLDNNLSVREKELLVSLFRSLAQGLE